MNDFDARDFYNCFEGGTAVTSNPRYMRRIRNELPEEYTNRQRYSTYPNFQAKIIDTFISYQFFHASTITDSELELEQIAKDASRHAMVGGLSYILALPVGLKAYSRLHVQRRVVDGLLVGYDIAGNDGKIDVNVTERIVTIEKKGAEVQTLPYVDDMVVELRCNEKGESLLRDTAPLNILIYNLQSVLDSLAQMMLLVYPYGPPIGEEKKPEQGTYITVNQGEVVPGFAQPRMDQVKILRDEINTRIMQMGRIVGLESEFSEETTVQSGIARAYQMIDTTAVINQIARETSNSVNRAASAWSLMTGRSGGTISINPIVHPEFKADTLREVRALLDLVKTDKVVKWAQRKAFLSVAANEMEKIKMDIADDIDRNGGLGAMDLGFDLTGE